jgi:hypothetical protein
MFTTLAMALAVLAAVAAVAWKRIERRRRAREADARPGTSPDTAIAIRSFEEMDSHVRAWRCQCGSRSELVGEGSREVGEHRFRVARLRCEKCEEERFLFFDTSGLLQ